MTAPAVFIGGCERSGTTLAGRVAADVFGIPFVPEAYFHLPALISCESNRSLSPWHELVRHPRIRTWQLSKVALRSPQPAPTTVPEAFRELVRRFARDPSRDGFVEHTPSNLRYASLLRSAYPGARFIHIVRDGRGVLNSVLQCDFGPTNALMAAEWWQASVLPGVLAELVYPRDVVRIRYEDLVADAVSTMRQAGLALGLPIESDHGVTSSAAAVLDHYTRRDHALLAESPDIARADAWRDQLSLRQLQEFEALAGGTLTALNYELSASTIWPSAARQGYARVADSLKRIVVESPRRLVRRYRADLLRLGDKVSAR